MKLGHIVNYKGKNPVAYINTNVCSSVSHTVHYGSKNVLTMQEKQESATDKNCSSDGEINTLSDVLIKRNLKSSVLFRVRG